MPSPATPDELTERFMEIPLMQSHMETPRKPKPPSKPKPDGKPVRPVRHRFTRLARLVASAWGWLCC